ncbi:MAG: N-6 DNA methylase [Candidatus Vecturithrix sp.]|jgi:predicted RNA methylase|nr:N-6 DNA methylase [Candidatus Vecturithrix sp.]
MLERKKREYGDFQTPEALAAEVVNFLQTHRAHSPRIVVEPTCGLGSFILAAVQAFQELPHYYAFDIHADYLRHLHTTLTGKSQHEKVNMVCQDFFTCDWPSFFNNMGQGEILVIGNPPWVTNAALGALNSTNLPTKTNFQGHTGVEAKTGKANFDIAEWMLITLIESLQGKAACVAMLCKMATARKVLHYAWRQQFSLSESSLHHIDAKKYFGVAVEACLFVTLIGKSTPTTYATLYEGLNFTETHSRFGLDHQELIANLEAYQQFKTLRGTSPYLWRSGVKHDAAKIMEFTKRGEYFINGFGETLDLEPAFIFPLLKSSDIGNARLLPQKYVLITQHHVGEATESIRMLAPKTWRYLLQHADMLDRRKSSIYRQRPRFSIFGIGDYSFAPWKVAVSGLYKSLRFLVIGSVSHKPVMVDDTCYFLPCSTHAEAEFIAKLLNSEVCQRLLQSLIFFDAKRPITKEILQRIDVRKIAQYYHLEQEAATYFSVKR